MTVREQLDRDNSKTPSPSSGWTKAVALAAFGFVTIVTLIVGPSTWHSLSTREWATVFWGSVLLVVAIAHPGVRSALAKFLRSLPGFWKVWIAVLALLGWMVVVLHVGYRLGMWNRDLLKDSIAWFLVYGFATVFAARKAPTEDRYFRRALVSALSLSALMQFFLNLHTFSIVVEVLLQLLVAFLVAMSTVAADQSRTMVVKKLMDGLLVIVGVWVIVGTAVGLWQSWRGIDPKQTGLAFAFSIWLPIAMLPFVYVLALTHDVPRDVPTHGVQERRTEAAAVGEGRCRVRPPRESPSRERSATACAAVPSHQSLSWLR